MKQFSKYLFLYFVGFFTYMLIEILYRGYTHISMGILGGFCFIFLGLINEVLSWNTPLYIQSLIGGVFITVSEFICGCIVNLWLGLNVWDYSNMPFNILGQICPQFFVLWVLISPFGIILDDYLRYWFFNEDKPRYILF